MYSTSTCNQHTHMPHKTLRWAQSGTVGSTTYLNDLALTHTCFRLLAELNQEQTHNSTFQFLETVPTIMCLPSWAKPRYFPKVQTVS